MCRNANDCVFERRKQDNQDRQDRQDKNKKILLITPGVH